MLQSNIADLKERQGAARKEVEEMRRQLKDSEISRFVYFYLFTFIYLFTLLSLFTLGEMPRTGCSSCSRAPTRQR